LCVIHSRREDEPLTASQQGDLNLVDWRVKGYGFVVIGWVDPAQRRAIAGASQNGFLLERGSNPRATPIRRAVTRGDLSCDCVDPRISALICGLLSKAA